MESECTDTEVFPGLRRGSPPVSPPPSRPVTALALGDLSSGRELQRLVELSIGKIALEKRRRSGANLRKSLHICDVIFKARMQLIKRTSSSSSTSPTPNPTPSSASASTIEPQQTLDVDATSTGSATACETVTEEEGDDDEEEERTRNASDRRAVPAPEEYDDYEDSCAQQPLCIYEPAAPLQSSTAPATSTALEIQRISSHRSVAESNSAPVQCVPQTRTTPPPQPTPHSSRKRSSSSEVTESTSSDAAGKRARLDRNNNGDGRSTTPSPPLSTPTSSPTSPQTVASTSDASTSPTSPASPFQWPAMPLLCPFPFPQPSDGNSSSSTAAGSLPASLVESLAAACSSSSMCASSPYGPLVPLLAPIPSVPYWCLVWSPLNWLPKALTGAASPIRSPTAATAPSGDESSSGQARADAVQSSSSSSSSPSGRAEFEASSSSRQPPLVVVID